MPGILTPESMQMDSRYRDESILFEDSRLQGANRITSMEIDPAARRILKKQRCAQRMSLIQGDIPNGKMRKKLEQKGFDI